MKELNLNEFVQQKQPLSLLRTRDGEEIQYLAHKKVYDGMWLFRYWTKDNKSYDYVFANGRKRIGVDSEESPYDLILAPEKETLSVTTTSCTNEKPVYALRHIQSGQFVDSTFSDKTYTLTSLDSYPHIEHSDKNYWKENNCIPETCEVVQLIKTTTITAIPV